jgi:hypothetical protein
MVYSSRDGEQVLGAKAQIVVASNVRDKSRTYLRSNGNCIERPAQCTGFGSDVKVEVGRPAAL